MKDYMITVFDFDNYEIHQRIGGQAYIGVFVGTRNEVVRWLKDHNVKEYGVGY
jgi:hypothetical protein